MNDLIYNEYFVWCAMALIIFVLTQVFKMPIKWCTKKYIKNERARKIANATILFIPFLLGITLDVLYSVYIAKTHYSIIVGLGYGSAGISLYGVIERFFKVKTNNPYETDNGKAVISLVENIVEDKKIDKNDVDAVKDFWDKIQ